MCIDYNKDGSKFATAGKDSCVWKINNLEKFNNKKKKLINSRNNLYLETKKLFLDSNLWWWYENGRTSI